MYNSQCKSACVHSSPQNLVIHSVLFRGHHQFQFSESRAYLSHRCRQLLALACSLSSLFLPPPLLLVSLAHLSGWKFLIVVAILGCNNNDIPSSSGRAETGLHPPALSCLKPPSCLQRGSVLLQGETHRLVGKVGDFI